MMPRAFAPLPILGLLAAGLCLGCGGGSTSKTSTPKDGGVEIIPGSENRDEALATVREKLYSKADLLSCQGAVRQLNVSLSTNPGQKRTPRDEATREKLGFTPEEWTEVNSATFTPLDAHHLEQCFLLRDAAQSLQVQALPPEKKAEAAFAWAVRQVRLTGRKHEILPPSYVLRRSWGSPAQRTHVFLALLRQLGMDGCVVIIPEKEPVVLAGVLAGKDIYLFDSRLGLPMPGAEPGSVLTLAQLRAQPDLLKQLSPNEKYPYDVTSAGVAKAEVGLVFELSELAPRMQRLQQQLASRVKVVLAADPNAQEKKFQEALKDSGVALKTWNRPEEAGSPARALRQFLPSDQGGADKPELINLTSLPGFAAPDAALQANWTRLYRYEKERTPWIFLPSPVRALPANSMFGTTARDIFAARYQSILARTEEPKPEEGEEDMPFGGGDMPERRRKAISLDDMPRALVLRGQTDKAQEQLRLILDALMEHRRIRQRVPDLDKKVTEWMSPAAEAYARLAQVREAGKGRADPEHVKAAGAQVAGLWSVSPLPLLFAEALTVPLNAEAMFTVALANQEYAERLQAKVGGASSPQVQDAWRAAEDGWFAFLREHSLQPSWAAAYRMKARALEGRGERDADRAIWDNLGTGLLENKYAPLSDLEKTACFIRAAQLKK
jgi:hypothetical protein